MAHDISKHPYWTHDEFMAFLLFYAANADMDCSDNERQMILSTITEGHLPEIEAEYNRLTDFERIQVIQFYKTKHYPSTSQKQEIMDALKKICNADGEYDQMERSMLLMLQKIL